MSLDEKDKFNCNRRSFLQFFTGSTLAILGQGLLPFSASCSNLKGMEKINSVPPFIPPKIDPSDLDQVILAQGLDHSILLQWQDTINGQGDTFGFNNDYIAFIPLSEETGPAGLLWINHEYIHPLFITGTYLPQEKTKAMVEKEQYEVGGSIVKIRYQPETRKWEVDKSSPFNRRFTGQTPFPLIGSKGEDKGMTYGTLGNCAGGLTPWKTFLTCEENFNLFYGEVDTLSGKVIPGIYGWEKYYPYPREHYGWVVEIDPWTGKGKKLMSMGRLAHESASVTRAKDGRVVVYTGDDKENECLYKFISHSQDSLEQGELFVANLEEGEWISLDYEKSPLLRQHFKDQNDVLTRTREAARLLGGTPLDRPEDIEIHPHHQWVFVALTNNVPKGNYFGQILKIEEESGDPGAKKFLSSTFAFGGEESGFACPDNLCFDRKGNLWMTSDISGSGLNRHPYQKFKNNGLYYFPLQGPHAGECFQLGSAPNDAELTGLCFSGKGNTLFLSVQHPGENTRDLNRPTSHWPLGGNHLPRPAVIQISGPTLEKLLE